MSKENKTLGEMTKTELIAFIMELATLKHAYEVNIQNKLGVGIKAPNESIASYCERVKERSAFVGFGEDSIITPLHW